MGIWQIYYSGGDIRLGNDSKDAIINNVCKILEDACKNGEKYQIMQY